MNTLPLLQPAHSREEFVELLQGLKNEFQVDPEGWENRTLPQFLEAMGRWVEDMDGYYLNRGEPVPEAVPWRVFSDFLLAARIYE